MNVEALELIAKYLAITNVHDISPDDYWRPQHDWVKDNYRKKALELGLALEQDGFKVIPQSDLDDLLFEARERGYDQGRLDEAEMNRP